jgi:dTDP-4-amino-4,6-dideoxy-D-galactose acyltransferase
VSRLKRLAWDSEILGMSVGRWEGSQLSDGERRLLEEAAESAGLDCVYLALDGQDPESWILGDRPGYLLVDVRLDFSLCPSATAESRGVRIAEAADVKPLAALAVASFRYSRFYFDPEIPRRRADDLYRAWVENSITGGYAEVTLVRGEVGSPEGFITCHLDGETGRIGLVGVSTEARGRGVGGRLVRDALAWFAARGATEVRVATQARNTGAQRLYQRAGFLVAESTVLFHYRPSGSRGSVAST